MKFVTPCGGKDLIFLVVSTSIGTPIDRVGGRGCRATGRGRAGGSLMTDKGGGWAEMVLSGAEGVECDTD